MDTTNAPTMPPHDTLIALASAGDRQGWETLACVVFAQVDAEAGWAWEHSRRTGWWFMARHKQDATRMEDLLSRHVHRALPNPFHDDGAAYRLETRELCGWESLATTRGIEHRHRHPGRDGWLPGPWHLDRRMAAALAVLHKHREHPTLAPVIRHLLENVPQ